MKIIKSGRNGLIIVFTLFLNILPMTGQAADWLYKVKHGENIWNISENYLKSVNYWKKLQRLNNVSDPYHIPPGTSLKIPVKWLKKQPIMARIYSSTGQIEITEGDDGKTTTVKPGDFVYAGDIVKTSQDALTVVEFIDGSTVATQQPFGHGSIEYLSQYRHDRHTPEFEPRPP